MVSGCSTLVQFQAVHEIRALVYIIKREFIEIFSKAKFAANIGYLLRNLNLLKYFCSIIYLLSPVSFGPFLGYQFY